MEIPRGECPPRSGSVQRDGIRQAGNGLRDGVRSTRPTGYHLLHFDSGPIPLAGLVTRKPWTPACPAGATSIGTAPR